MENRRAVLGVEVALNTRVQKLIIEDGAVRGVVVDGQQIRSRAVLLACGGLEHADEQLVRTWFPDAYDTLPAGCRPQSVARPNNRGDGVILGQQANADIIGKNCGLAAHSWILPNRPPGNPGRQPKSSIYVNERGQRFAAETAPYAVMPGLIKAQNFKVWGIFDEGARLRADPTAALISAEWDPAFVLDCVKRGDIIVGDTIEDLAGKCGMRPSTLKVTIAQWNEDVRAGKDRWFDREMDQIHPSDQGPWYAYRMGLTEFVLTGVGPRIDPDCHALDTDGRIIPGLFAAGEASGGVLGERYVGGGNSVANAITMGRVAGLTIGRELKG
jgi:fumarate reductase flavoprotein subunit